LLLALTVDTQWVISRTVGLVELLCMVEYRKPNSKMARVATKSSLLDEQDDVAYWLSLSGSQRIAAVEILRQRVFGGVDGTRQGLQRVCRIVSRA